MYPPPYVEKRDLLDLFTFLLERTHCFDFSCSSILVDLTEVFDVDHNDFTGTIPNKIGRLTNLRK
jgi:hypothetical protein